MSLTISGELLVVPAAIAGTGGTPSFDAAGSIVVLGVLCTYVARRGDHASCARFGIVV